MMFNFSGCVVTMDCVEKLIKKDMLDPINSKKMTEKDIIVLQRVSNHSNHVFYMTERKKILHSNNISFNGLFT